MEQVRHKRPIGISILSWLHIIVGVLAAIVIASLLLLFAMDVGAKEAFSILGHPLRFLAVGLMFLAVLGIASGIGMWTGKKWGWYVGSFYYVYNVITNLNTLIMIPSLLENLAPEETAAATHGPTSYYIKHGGRVIVHFLLYLYFFKGNVRAFFGLSEQRRWKPVLAEITICLVILHFLRKRTLMSG